MHFPFLFDLDVLSHCMSLLCVLKLFEEVANNLILTRFTGLL